MNKTDNQNLSNIIPFIILSISFFIWGISIIIAQKTLLNLENLSGFGLIKILPWTFFLAVTLETISFFITLKFLGKNQIILFFHVVVLIVFLFSTPTLIETYRARNSYSSMGFTHYIIRNEHIDPSKVWYHNWPIIHIATAILIEVTKITPNILIYLFPTLPQLLYFLPMFMFGSRLTSDIEKTWIGVWTFYFINWIGQDFFSAQSLILFILEIFLFLLYDITEKKHPSKLEKGSNNLSIERSKKIIFILCFIILTTGHFFSSLYALSIIIFFYFFKYERNKISLLLFLVILSFWIISGATHQVRVNLHDFIKYAFHPYLIIGENLPGKVAGSAEHIIISQSKIAYTILVLFFTISGFFVSLRKNRDLNKKIIVGLTSGSVFVIFFPYGGELFMRIYLFSLMMVSLLISKNLDSKKMSFLLIIFLAGAPILHITCHYGNEKHDFIPLSEVKGSSFLYTHIPDGKIIGGSPWAEFLGSYDQYEKIIMPQISFTDDNVNLSGYEERILSPYYEEYGSLYLIINWGDKSYFNLFLNSTDFFSNLEIKVLNIEYYSKIYSSPFFELYKLQKKNIA